MKFPKVGEKFYWKTQEGEIVESTCFKIEEEDNPDLETMFFTSISKNGGGTFITESDILNPLSEEVQKFKNEIVEVKIKKIANLVLEPEVHNALVKKLTKDYDYIDVINILYGLSSLK